MTEQKETRMRCGVKPRSAEELGAPEDASITVQQSEREENTFHVNGLP